MVVYSLVYNYGHHKGGDVDWSLKWECKKPSSYNFTEAAGGRNTH